VRRQTVKALALILLFLAACGAVLALCIPANALWFLSLILCALGLTIAARGDYLERLNRK
jgi:uncharacterized membrane protein YoaK (UPF0700 family)